jgi:hypothetical protein
MLVLEMFCDALECKEYDRAYGLMSVMSEDIAVVANEILNYMER